MGKAAAECVYAWEDKLEIEVEVVDLPPGQDPGDLPAVRTRSASVRPSKHAIPFLGFRVERVIGAARLTSNEARAAAAEAAIAVVNEHPNELVRRQYVVEVAVRCGLPPDDLVAMAVHETRRPWITVVAAAARPEVTPETTVLVVALDDWAGVRPWLHEVLFDDPTHRAAFRALDQVGGQLPGVLEVAAAAAELLQRLAVEEPAMTRPRRCSTSSAPPRLREGRGLEGSRRCGRRA